MTSGDHVSGPCLWLPEILTGCVEVQVFILWCQCCAVASRSWVLLPVKAKVVCCKNAEKWPILILHVSHRLVFITARVQMTNLTPYLSVFKLVKISFAFHDFWWLAIFSPQMISLISRWHLRLPSVRVFLSSTFVVMICRVILHEAKKGSQTGDPRPHAAYQTTHETLLTKLYIKKQVLGNLRTSRHINSRWWWIYRPGEQNNLGLRVERAEKAQSRRF